MEYNLHRRKKLTYALKASIYEVHDRIELASVTRKLLLVTQEQKGNPLHNEILNGSPFKLRPVTTICKVRVPTLEELQSERVLEHQRLEKINLHSQLAQQVELELKSDTFLTRRPLPPNVPWVLCKQSLWN